MLHAGCKVGMRVGGDTAMQVLGWQDAEVVTYIMSYGVIYSGWSRKLLISLLVPNLAK